MTQFTTGTRVRVIGAGGSLFYSGNKGKLGTVTRLTRGDEIVHVRFDDGVEDYGRPVDLERVTSTSIVVGSKVKVIRSVVFLSKYKGQIGEVYRVSGRTIYVVFEEGGRDYGLIDELELVVEKDAAPARRIKREDVKQGMKVKLVSDNRGHRHWGFVIGGVYDCIDGGIIAKEDVIHRSQNWGDWVWEVVAEAPAPTLDEQLAALRTELDGVKAEKAAAEAAVTAAQAKVDAVEVRRIALVGRLAKHGIQFIGESAGTLTGLQAHEAGVLKLGSKLLTVSTADSSEHTNGREYAVIRVDAHDSDHTYKLESNDCYGFWLVNEQLAGYTLVA